MRCHFIIAEFFDAYDELTPKEINSWLNLHNSKISSLGNLVYIHNSLDLSGSNITSFGNLEWVGNWIDICETSIRSFGKLRVVQNLIYCDEGEQFNKLQAENTNDFTLIKI